VQNDATYANYVVRQSVSASLAEKDERIKIPESLDYRGLSGLSTELVEKLTRVRPESLGQAQRIEGMTPTALALVLSAIRRSELRRVG